MVLVDAGASVVVGVVDDAIDLQMAFVGVVAFSVIPVAMILVVAVLHRREQHRSVTPG
jgi:sugar phosphate permease